MLTLANNKLMFIFCLYISRLLLLLHTTSKARLERHSTVGVNGARKPISEALHPLF
jgi:hypothetical protein